MQKARVLCAVLRALENRRKVSNGQGGNRRNVGANVYFPMQYTHTKNYKNYIHHFNVMHCASRIVVLSILLLLTITLCTLLLNAAGTFGYSSKI